MKLRKNPLGEYIGKIGNTVGGKWKNTYWVRVFVYPTQRGTLEKYNLLKKGMIAPEQFSYKQMNIRRLSLSPLGWIAENNLDSLIYPVWERAKARKHRNMSGVNAFIQANARTLYNSMTHKDQEYNETTNTPDIKKIQMSTGILEADPTGLIGANYTPLTGIVTADWSGSHYTNGKDNDYAYMVVLRKPILVEYGEDKSWIPYLWMYGEAKLPLPPAVPKTRDGGHIELEIPKGLVASDLVTYVFFRDNKNEIGFSPSVSRQCV